MAGKGNNLPSARRCIDTNGGCMGGRGGDNMGGRGGCRAPGRGGHAQGGRST